MRSSFTLTILLVAFTAAALLGAVPTAINFQGFLTDASGYANVSLPE